MDSYIFRYLTSVDCSSKHGFVCSQKPLTAKPDNPCPKDFYPYKTDCLRIEKDNRMDYERAQVRIHYCIHSYLFFNVIEH